MNHQTPTSSFPHFGNNFWCHTCTSEIYVESENNLICPNCGSDFIERLEEHVEQTQQPVEPNIPPMGLGELCRHLFGLFNQAPATQTGLPQQGGFGGVSGDPLQFHMFAPPQNIGAGATTPTFSFTTSNDPLGSIGGIVQQLLSGNMGNFGVPLYGNPGDYVWGSNQELDRLLNQLFQQHNNRGNPPAAQSVVANLPSVKITSKQVEESSDCAICKDEFQLNENVLELPCHHLFHASCIQRWLTMHNQCPVCRHELQTDDPEYEQKRKGQQGPSSFPSQ